MRKAVSIICIIAIVIAASYLLYEFVFVEIQADSTYTKASESIINDCDDEEKLKEEYKKKYPDIKFPDDMLLKYYPVYVQNQDLKGWISIPEFDVDLPIVQSKDNEYYLRKDIDRKYFAWGVPFFDYRNTFNPDSTNLIVYGHNSKYIKNKMFGPLDNYLTVAGYKKAPIIKCDTIFEEQYWKVYAAFTVSSNPNSKDYFDYMITDFQNESQFIEYIADINKRAGYSTGIDINPSDRLLTLSTCNYKYKDARLVVVCRKVRVGENV